MTFEQPPGLLAEIASFIQPSRLLFQRLRQFEETARILENQGVLALLRGSEGVTEVLSVKFALVEVPSP